MKYDKLVRDRIPDIIRAQGRGVTAREADPEEYGRRLIDKLHEEVEEFVRDRNAEELADILEVIKALCLHLGLDPRDVEALRLKKALDRGGFEKRLILEDAEEKTP